MHGLLSDTENNFNWISISYSSWGGTTAIESILNGRKTICSDINSLASYITKAKATPLNKDTLDQITNWHLHAIEKLKEYRKLEVPENFRLYNNLHSRKTVWILQKLKEEINSEANQYIKNVSNLILLNVGKNCYDCQDKSLNPSRLIKSFEKISQLVIKSLSEYSMPYKAVNNYRNFLHKFQPVSITSNNALSVSLCNFFEMLTINFLINFINSI